VGFVEVLRIGVRNLDQRFAGVRIAVREPALASTGPPLTGDVLAVEPGIRRCVGMGLWNRGHGKCPKKSNGRDAETAAARGGFVPGAAIGQRQETRRLDMASKKRIGIIVLLSAMRHQFGGHEIRKE
jgi:hypothetical protein